MPLNAIIPDRSISPRHLSAPISTTANTVSTLLATPSVLQIEQNSTLIVRVVVLETTTKLGTPTLDGVVLQLGDVVLYNTTDETENGFYIVQSGSWVRTDNQIVPGQLVLVADGVANKSSLWVQERIFATYYLDETEVHWVLINEQFVPDELAVEQSATVALELEASLLRADLIHTNSDTVELATTVGGLQATVREDSLSDDYFTEEVRSQNEHPYYMLSLLGNGFTTSAFSWVIPQQVIGVRRAFPIGVYLVSVWVEVSQVDGSNFPVNNSASATLVVNGTTVDTGDTFDPAGVGSPKLIVNALQGTCIVPVLSTSPSLRTITITVQLPNGVNKFASGTAHLVRLTSQETIGNIETHPL